MEVSEAGEWGSLSFGSFAAGLPLLQHLNPALSKSCEKPNSSCALDSPIKDARFRYPTYQTWTSPTYANYGFILLGSEIAEIANQSLPDVYRKALFEPLGISSSNATDPTHLVDRVVLSGRDLQYVFTDSGFGTASGGIFSTLNDRARFSISIMNSTLLPEEKTRR